MSKLKTKEKIISLINDMIENRVITSSDLQRFAVTGTNTFDPEGVRLSYYNWYMSLGIEQVIQRRFELGECPFSETELKLAEKQNQIVICVPKGLTRIELGKLFRLESWVLNDPLVTPVTENEDCWFLTPKSSTPEFLGEKGIDLEQRFDRENKINFSIERYMVFIARMRFLTGELPDQQYWIWLPSGRYDRSGMLMSGFDRYGRLSIHGWMPQFSASFLGARYGIKPKSEQNV